MTSNDKRKKATVCVLALVCVALMVATSMACVVNNDNGASIDSRTDLIIGKENPPGQDPVAEKEDVATDDNGKKFWNGLIKYQVKTDTTCKVINYSSKDLRPVVPDIACMEGHKYIVDEIGEDAFKPPSAFSKMLNYIEIGPYVKTISKKGVNGINHYGHTLGFTIRDLEHSQLSYIGKEAFSYSDVVTIELPASLTLIDDDAFSHCNDLESVVLHSKSLQICHNAFNNCFRLKSINLENVARIGSYAFQHCAMDDVNLSSAWDIREMAFDECNLMHITFAKNIVILEDAFPGYCFSDFNNNILPKNPSGLAGKEFRKDIDNWYHQIR